MSTPKKMTRTERAIAESPVPVLPVHPRGVVRRYEGRIEAKDLMARPRTPPPTPERHHISPFPSPRKKKDVYDILFMNKRPAPASPSKSTTERARNVSAPYDSPSSPLRHRVGRRVASGPAPDLYYAKVAQNSLLPEGASGPPLPRDATGNIVRLGRAEAGCCIVTPDAVENGPLGIGTSVIFLAFQWEGYDAYKKRVNLCNFRTPFEARLEIISNIRDMFEEFKSTVRNQQLVDIKARHDTKGKGKARQDEGEEKKKKATPVLDVLAFGDSDVRVTKLERRMGNFYQVIFTVPARRMS